MSKATRMLAMTGLAMVAGLTFSAGPAAASSSTAQGATTATQSTQQGAQAHRDRDREWVQGYYRTRGQCIRVGLIGKRFDRWDRFRCERVRHGFRSIYRLKVERDWNWNNDNDWNNGHGHHGGGHDWNNDNNGGGHWNQGPRR
ncbi:hypothetical protein GCM10020358_34760 [Amorphoplanes nipponensis]|uniref:Uncharacterized protein n=1 Tax=Actinoplanes nipponensis TaxID=135950 RepID=A0A919JJD9_9ACTN|nr:hypothetical protein [Actinoplanes nipponensis]GIE52094.1 hypothetical protein Ani05nite_56280 [Actinoplanes nipponensis]